MGETLELTNVTSEIFFVGSCFSQPDLYLSYGEYMRPKYDFSDVVTRFLYESFELYYLNFSENVTREKVNAFMSQDEARLSRYNQYGGYDTVESWMNLSDADDIENYFNLVKKYSLLREYHRNGYNVEAIMVHPKFQQLTAQDIYRLVRGKVDRVFTIISASEDSIPLNHGIQNTVSEYLIAPQMGLDYPWWSINEMFRGMRLGKIVLNGFLSNEGKSRNLMLLMAHTALVKKQKFLLMSNEMSEDDLRSALITTVLNNECFKKLHGVSRIKKEREIVLGIYFDDNGKQISRYVDEDGNFLESEEEYTQRVYKTSAEYRDVLRVAKFLEEEGNGFLLFKDVGTGYSDEMLEHEIRRHALVYGVKYFGYDTLKGWKTDDWQSLKQTTTRLKELATELNIFMWAVFQLTDDTHFTNVFDLSSNNIANAKQIKHVVDYLLLGKRIYQGEYMNYEYASHEVWGEPKILPLDQNKKYFAVIVDKNRGGSKQFNPLFEYDLDLNIWKNVGSLIHKGL